MALVWQLAVDFIRPYVVRISTPQSSGTGFLIYRSETSGVCGIATAAHVIDHPHYWEQPIRIDHFDTGKSVLLRHDERAILLDEKRDTALVILPSKELPLPKDPPELTPEERYVKVGIEVGWLGFPAVSSRNLCYFSGRTSCVLKDEHAYLVDGVAINGVSGGPTFLVSSKDKVVVIGVVSAYIANRATGETLPGLSVVRDVSHFQEAAKSFKSLEQAKQSEAAPEKPPSSPGAQKEEAF